MDIQINENKKVDINAPVKIAGRRSFTVTYLEYQLDISGTWIPADSPTIRTIDFPLSVYNEFIALTTKQRYKRALEYLFPDLDREYLRTEEERMIDYINKVSTDPELKSKLMLFLNEALIAKA